MALRSSWPDAPSISTHAGAGAAGVGCSRPFLLLAVAFVLSSLAMYTVVVASLPLLLERGYTTSQAAWTLGISGAGQSLDCALYAALARRTTAATRTPILIPLGGSTTDDLVVYGNRFGKHP